MSTQEEDLKFLICMINDEAVVDHVEYLDDHIDMTGWELKASGLDVSVHRWYETATKVYDTPYGLVGLNGVAKCYSEDACVEDIGVKIRAFKVQEVHTVSYEETA